MGAGGAGGPETAATDAVYEAIDDTAVERPEEHREPVRRCQEDDAIEFVKPELVREGLLERREGLLPARDLARVQAEDDETEQEAADPGGARQDDHDARRARTPGRACRWSAWPR